jgi:hypothetical protein
MFSSGISYKLSKSALASMTVSGFFTKFGREIRDAGFKAGTELGFNAEIDAGFNPEIDELGFNAEIDAGFKPEIDELGFNAETELGRPDEIEPAKRLLTEGLVSVSVAAGTLVWLKRVNAGPWFVVEFSNLALPEKISSYRSSVMTLSSP